MTVNLRFLDLQGWAEYFMLIIDPHCGDQLLLIDPAYININLGSESADKLELTLLLRTPAAFTIYSRFT